MTAVDTRSSNNNVSVIGYGALGREIVTQLLAAGREVRVIQRSSPKTCRRARALSPPTSWTELSLKVGDGGIGWHIKA